MRSGLGLLAPREEGSYREKQGFGIQVPPPPPAACQEGIILDYPAVSSHPRGRLQPWERDPLPGPWVESPRREGQASPGSSSTFRGCSAGRGRGGRGCWEEVSSPNRLVHVHLSRGVRQERVNQEGCFLSPESTSALFLSRPRVCLTSATSIFLDRGHPKGRKRTGEIGTA